jgi:hypothetical protein
MDPVRKNFKPRFNLTLLFTSALFILLLSGCKKDLGPDPNGESQLQSDAAKNGMSKFGKADLAVHKNGSIQAAVDAAQPGMLIQIEPELTQRL